jgi:hypothetical protein
VGNDCAAPRRIVRTRGCFTRTIYARSTPRADKFVRSKATPSGLLDALNDDIKAYGFALVLERREVDGVVCIALVNTREDAAIAENKAHSAAFFQLFNALITDLMTECVRRGAPTVSLKVASARPGKGSPCTAPSPRFFLRAAYRRLSTAAAASRT